MNIYIIKLLLDIELYKKFNQEIDFSDNKELTKLLYVIRDYYESNDSSINTVENLESIFFSAYPALREKDIALFTTVFDRLRSANPDPAFIEEYLKSLRKSKLATELALKALEVAEGRGEPQVLTPYLEAILELPNAPTRDIQYTTSNLDEIFSKHVDSTGLKWSLKCLNKSLGPLRKGDFGFVFKRPETGGTTFLASEVTFMATQVDTPILWINNEEQSEKVILRCYQSLFECTLDELYKQRVEYQRLWEERTNNQLRIISDISSNYRNVSDIIQHISPSLVIVDQLDKVTGFKADRKDLEYGAIYRWAREIAKEYCPVIGVCQASVSAENKMWLSMEDIAEAKTSKAAEADWVLGIGAVDDIGKRNLRYLSICKNKLIGGAETVPEMRHARMTVLFKPEIAKYKDISE